MNGFETSKTFPKTDRDQDDNFGTIENMMTKSACLWGTNRAITFFAKYSFSALK